MSIASEQPAVAHRRSRVPAPQHELICESYADLHRIALVHIRGERRDIRPQAASLVHDAYLRISAWNVTRFNDRQHFFAAYSRVMKRILVDEARRRAAAKRGGEAGQVTLDDRTCLSNARSETPAEEDRIALERVLQRFAELEPRRYQVVQLRFYEGLTEEEIAAELAISLRTVKRDWLFAREWLHRELTARQMDAVVAVA